MPSKQPRRVGPAAAGSAGPPSASANPLPTVPLLVFALLALVCTALYFFDAPQQHIQQRQQSLLFLVAPDQLLAIWCGGKLEFFSLFDRWPIALLAATILATAWLAGRLALIALGITTKLDTLERSVFAIAVGLNLLSLYALAIGLAGGLNNRWLFVAPLILLALANIVLFGTKPVPGISPSPSLPLSPSNANTRYLYLLLPALPFSLVILLGSMLPPWAYDVREYHLQAPKEWFQNGRIEFLPHNIYANMPLGSELTALWGMALYGGPDAWWWGALAGKTVMACYSLVTAAGLFAFGRRLHSTAAGVIAAVVFLTTPWTAALANAGYNEGPVALYALLAIYSLWLACSLPLPLGVDRGEGGSIRGEMQSPSDVRNSTAYSYRFILLSGFLAGSSVACKYPSLLFVVAPLFVFILGHSCFEVLWSLVIRHSSLASEERLAFKTPLLHATLFLLAATAASGPWFAKNWVLTHNPTYPLLYSLFDGRTRTSEKDRQFTKVHSPQPDSQGHRFSPRQFVDQLTWNTWRTLFASLAIPPLFVVAFLSQRHRPFMAGSALWIAFVLIAWFLFTHRLDRFLVLLLPIAALIAALGATAVDHPAWRIATLTFIITAAIAHFPFVTLHPDNRYFAPLEKLRRDDSDLALQGHHVESAHRWLNAHARPGEKVLLLGDAEPFDLELPAIYNTCFDDCQFTRIFQGRTREERLAALRDEKIAYLFCSWTHLNRYRSPGNYGYTSDYPTRDLVHQELVEPQKLLIPIPIQSEPEYGELFRVAEP